MKKIIAFVLTVFMFMGMTCFAQDINVTISGKKLDFDVQPVMESDRVLVPMRAIFENLGATVSWDNDTSTAIAVKGDKVIIIQIDNSKAFINTEVKELDVPARLISDRTLVPVRFVSEALNCKVDWNQDEQTVVITPGQ